MVRPEEFRDPQLDVSGDVVGFYPREFYVLDNFAAFQVDYLDRRWPTSEHAYHAAKFVLTAGAVVEEIFKSRSPHDALMIARRERNQRRADWDDIKVATMEDICRLKMLQNPFVRQKLLLSGDLDIVEDSPKDDFWGWGPNRDGRNELGKIWMRIRTDLRAEE